MATINNRFGVLLAQKKAREKRNIPMIEIEREIGINRRTLYVWEKNTVTRYDAPVILALCQYFNCDIGDLLYIDRSPDS